MNIRQDLRFSSEGCSNPLPQQATYDAGVYISENIGPSSSNKMPIYERRNNENVIRSNLPSPTDLSRPHKDYHGTILYLIQYTSQYKFIH